MTVLLSLFGESSKLSKAHAQSRNHLEIIYKANFFETWGFHNFV
jgi:hypothetical protein